MVTRKMVGEITFSEHGAFGAHLPRVANVLDFKGVYDGRWGSTAWSVDSGGVACSIEVDSTNGLVVFADVTLYAHDRLAARLGHSHGGLSDACLLLRAYRKWGEGMLAYLDGDYAFVICDLRCQSAFAATDPAGMRPLFYRYVQGKSFAFSTNAEDLALWSGLDPRLPECRLLEPIFFCEHLAHVDPEIEGIERLLAANFCSAASNGIRVVRYWTPGEVHPGIDNDDVRGWSDALRRHLEAAVNKRLSRNTNAGVMFSGGMDSSSILVFAAKFLPRDRLATYSVLDRKNSGCPETRAIDRVLLHTGAQAVGIDIHAMQEFTELSRKLAAQAPRFVLGRSGFHLLFNKLASESGVSIMMNGLDGDSMFYYEDYVPRRIRDGGYESVLHDARRQDLLCGVAWMEATVRRARYTARLPWWLRNLHSKVQTKIRGRSDLQEMLFSKESIRKFALSGRLGEGIQSSRPQAHVEEPVPTNMLSSPVVLDAVGRLEAMHRCMGVEMRCPFLDRSLMDFAAWIPLGLRFRNGHLKWILREAMSPLLPDEVIWRGDKAHLGAHFDREMLQPVLEQVIRDFRGTGPAIAPYIDRGRFLQEAERWQSGAIEAVWKLEMWLLLENWLQCNSAKVAWQN